MFESVKAFFELMYWKTVKLKSKGFNNDYYKFFYTDFYKLSESFYKDKKLLDIGCGPRGSLEWAEMAALRIGADPLVHKYLKLGADKHRMQYVKAFAESLPFEDAFFDVVSAFNALDHVRCLDSSCNEIKRVLKIGGHLLVIVNIHRFPTLTEPHVISWDFIESYFKEFEVIEIKRLKEIEKNKIYRNLRHHVCIENKSEKTGVLTAILKKI